MSGEFRIRDGLLAGYYLLFLTLNWFLPAFFWRMGEFAVVLFAFAGVTSAAVVIGRQFNERGERRYNPFCFGAFLVLMSSLVAVDVWIAFESL